MIKFKTIIIIIFLAQSKVFSNISKNNLNICTASNFLTTLKIIKNEFEKENNCNIIISSDSTTNIYTKIVNGAPFDIFISADTKHVKLLKEKNLTINDDYIYALGILILLNKEINTNKIKKNIKNISISNPKLSPYGKATQLFIKNTKLKINNDIIYGSNVNQVHNFIISENSKLGFISLSQIINKKTEKNNYWIIPEYLYPQITQKITIIKNNKNLKLSIKFMDYIKSKKIQDLILNSGYKL